MSATTTAPTTYPHIEMTESVLGAEPRLAGRRLRVRDIAAARDHGGYTPEQIAGEVYPQLSLGEVYGALAYYEDHRHEMEALERTEEGYVTRFKREHPELVGADLSQ